MIKRMLLIGIAFLLLYGQSSWAENKNSSIRPGNFFKVSAYVDTLTITTVTPNWTYPKAGIQILTPGYTVAHMSPGNNGYYLFSVSDTVPANLTLIGAPGPVSIKLCLNGVGSGTSCEILTVALTKQKYAYVASGFNQVVYKCHVNSDGTLYGCGPAHPVGVPGWVPESIAFATVNGIQYAYVASWPNGIVYQCTLNAEGSFDICNALTPTGAVYAYAAGITFATISGIQYAYVSDDFAKVYRCSLKSDGTFNACAPTTPATSTLGWMPVSTTFATIGGVQFAYVASDTGDVYRCSLNFGGSTNGTFNTCTVITPASGAPNWLPKSITFATFDTNLYAYVSDDNGDVFRCSLNLDGTFNVCSETPGPGAYDWSPRTVAFETFGGTQYAYVADFGTAISLYGDVYRCTLNAEGKFTKCAPTPVSGVAPGINLWWVAFN